MPSPAPAQSPARSADRRRFSALLLIIALITLARILYLIFLCPYDLVEDEAQYWLWAQHPGWSYYSKGPGVAWAIGLSTAAFGNAEWAVRLPAAIAAAVSMFAVAGLARDIAGNRAAAFALAAFVLAPANLLTATLMTIDGPYVACWAVACWAAWRALHDRSAIAWLALGAAVGIGFLFKYTILLLIPGLVLHTLIARAQLRPAPIWRFAAPFGFLLALVGLAPVLIWNSQHDWPTVRHLLGHIGVSGGDMPVDARSWSPTWTIEFLGTQLAMIGPLLVLALWASARAWRERSTNPGNLFLLLCAAPILLFYLALSFFAEPEGNWPLAGYVTLLMLAGLLVAGLTQPAAPGATPSMKEPGFSPRRLLWHGSIVYGIGAAFLLSRGDLIARAVNTLNASPPVANAAESLGLKLKPIVTGRLIGARRRAEHVGRLLESLRAQGSTNPFVMADHYGRASQMAYYLPRQPDGARVLVLSASRLMGGRPSQFDYWPDTDPSSSALAGRDAILLSNDKPITLAAWEHLFQRVEPAILESGPADQPARPARLDGEHKKDRVAYISRGYRPGATLGGSRP